TPVTGSIRPTRLPGISVNHRFPSGPALTTSGWPPAATGNSVIPPVDGLSRPMAPAVAAGLRSVNHTAPSGPVATEVGLLLGVATANSVIAPSSVIRPTLFPRVSANQTLPSGPTVSPSGALPAVGIANSMTEPVALIRPIALAVNSVNHIAP